MRWSTSDSLSGDRFTDKLSSRDALGPNAAVAMKNWEVAGLERATIEFLLVGDGESLSPDTKKTLPGREPSGTTGGAARSCSIRPSEGTPRLSRMISR